MPWIRRARLAAAGAVALTAITVATAGATGATGRTVDAAPPVPGPRGSCWRGPLHQLRRPPGAGLTTLGGINNRGQITGGSASDVNSAATAASAFVLRKGLEGPISPIAVPGRGRHLRRRDQRPWPDRRRLPDASNHMPLR